MPLESLLDLVERLRERMGTHGDALRASEALTRYALIDPLLRELGWTTEDPDQVRPEYPLRTEYNPGTRSADYALLANGRPAVMVEAKKLGTPLRDAVLIQGINYCQMEGTGYFAVTDGSLWEIYETHKPVPIDEKRIITFDLNGPSVAEVCLKAMALWRPSVRSGQINTGQAPIVAVDDGQPNTPRLKVEPHRPGRHKWQQLTEVTPATGQKPVEMLFPDDSRTPMKNWRSGPIEVVRWLMDKRMLTASDCPLMQENPKAFRYVVNTQPVHSNGARFTSPFELNGLYIETHDNISALVNKTKLIIERAGQAPSQFRVRFS